jgi:hypothetical protein
MCSELTQILAMADERFELRLTEESATIRGNLRDSCRNGDARGD